MARQEFEKQAALLLENLAKSRQIAGRSKILLEDLNSLMILTIESRVRRATGRIRRSERKVRKSHGPLRA